MGTINTALLSYGMSGKLFHAPFIDAHTEFILAGAWERSKKMVVADYPNAKSYNSFEQILEDESVQLVVVNTPTYTHFEYAKRALEAGKHVIVEKAFTTTVKEAEELNKLAKLKERKLSVYQNRRWDSDFRTVQEVIQRGVLGNIVEVSFSFDRFNPQLSPKLHKEKQAPGAGLLNDLGPHLIDQAICLFGLPSAVFATLDIIRKLSVVDDFFEILLFYPKLLIRLRASYFVKEPLPAYIIHGTAGSFIKSRADMQESALKKGIRPDEANWGIEPESASGILHTEIEGRSIREPVNTLAGNYMTYYDGIYRAIIQNKQLPVTAEEGIQVMKIIEAARQSNEENCVISLR